MGDSCTYLGSQNIVTPKGIVIPTLSEAEGGGIRFWLSLRNSRFLAPKSGRSE